MNPCDENTFQETQSPDKSTCMCRPGFGDYGTTLDSMPDPKTRCPECPIGTFQGGYTRGSCTSCATVAINSITLASQRSSSSDCVCDASKGFALDTSSNSCLCPPGMGLDGEKCESRIDSTYKSSAGDTSCVSCGTHTTTGGFGADSIDDCVCKVTFLLDGATNQCSCPTGLGYNSDTQLCDVCPHGKFSDKSSLDPCTSCPLGTYQPIFKATSIDSCLVCMTGKYSTTPSATSPTSCESCASGKFLADTGTDCALHNSAEQCLDCAIGKFNADSAAGSCVECAAGRYSDSIGSNSASACTPCAKGKWSDSVGLTDVSGCTSCPKGTYSDVLGADTHSCTICQKGTYNPNISAEDVSSCLRCDSGTYLADDGGQPSSSAEDHDSEDDCVSCKKGTYVPNQGASECYECGVGKYLAVEGAVSADTCVDCIAGKRNPNAGSPDEVNCVACESGKWSSQIGLAGSCTDCAKGYYNPYEGEQTSTIATITPVSYFSHSHSPFSST